MNDKPSIFLSSLEDLFSSRVLLVSLFSFILTIAFFVVTLFFLFGSIESLTQWFVAWMGSFEQTIEQNWLLGFISLIFITKTIVGILVVVTSTVVVYYLFLMVYSFIIGLFAGFFIKEIGQKYYPDVPMHGIDLFSYLFYTAKALFIGLLLLVVLSPLLLIPLLNLILFIPVYYIFHKMLVLEVSSAINVRAEYLSLKKRYRGELRGLSLVCFGVTLIPIAGVLIYPLYVIVMSHFIFQKTRELRG